MEERLISAFGDSLAVFDGLSAGLSVSPGASVISGSVPDSVFDGVGR
ncbi:hypothetical protein [Nocardioides hankookensis]|uniref:Uncharacterized protein n=1 Tax=Nocardioides hankookensis TaxID=443157 RepID=A0ABW1LFN9_9ACTN